MDFITDKQTLDELNLLGKYSPGSVYGLFNHVKTRGGELLLEQWLRHLLTNAEKINERTAIFEYFQRAAQTFPFENALVAKASVWLENDGSRTFTGAMLSAIQKKTLSVLIRDERYDQQQAGIMATGQVLDGLINFVNNLTKTIAVIPFSYQVKIRRIKEILSDSRVEKLSTLIAEKSNLKKLSWKEMAHYEHLLKKTLSQEVEAVLDFIYELDVLMAVSNVARDRNFSYAKAINAANEKEANQLKIKELKHPALEKAVGNDMELDSDQNLLFLTGANMAGKSTLMKSIGIALYLAHAGFPVAAKEMIFTVRDGLYTSINVPDNINLGYSHFYAEVLRVKQAAELVAQGKNMLVMFDELFKGTNVKDAYEGTWTITEAFASYTNCLFIVSTHIIEVAEVLKSTKNIRFAYMPTVMNGSHPLYTFKMQAGVTEDRQGMLIIRNEGILELLP